jgi:hypothetical protein
MIQDLFYVGCENSNNPNGIKITITTDNGTFVIDDSTVGVFYKLPPGYSGNYPTTEYQISPKKLNFQGNINSVYSELHVQSNENMLVGTVQVQPALPVIVYIGSYGGRGSFDLPAGTTSAQFKIPIGNYGAEGEAPRTSRLAQIVNESEKVE